jgi:hypothetical protein
MTAPRAMNPLYAAIRKTPLDYLPEVSLRAFLAFRSGYLYRAEIEGHRLDPGFEGLRFHTWLCDYFQIRGHPTVADTSIVSSFSSTEDAAFVRYFDLLDEFLAGGVVGDDVSLPRPSRKETGRTNFCELLRQIRRRPPMYFGSCSFNGLRAYLMGDEHAYRDLKLPGDEGRELFKDFQHWIESEKNNSSQFRPWYRVIEFYGFHDSAALDLFFAWFDRYAVTIGKPGFFAVEELNASAKGAPAQSRRT